MYSKEREEFYEKERIENQTVYMAFQPDCIGETLAFNIFLIVYNKKKQINRSLNLKEITGKNGFKTMAIALKMLNKLEEEVYYSVISNLKDNSYIIYCSWEDNRRRNTYYKVLSKRGFKFGNLEGKKVLFKKIELEEERRKKKIWGLE